jgi:pimeloyl-ACP methyl ester carboxylesterase
LPEKVESGKDHPRPGLVLTLHGASVEAIGQAEAYAPKPGLHIVAPTNRRPFGFDWEDWGRLDAVEVLERSQQLFATDPFRTYLTGHSMGGHGTWHLGVTFPDRFAAIAPSAGWISMWSYAGARRTESPDPVQELLERAAAPSDTVRLARNLASVGVYVLHGNADDNVPVDQARRMRQILGEFHPDFAYHEQTGAGHWWGNACVDWPPLFAFLERRLIPPPAEVREVDFTTVTPGVSSHAHWATIECQVRAMSPSAVHLRLEPERRRFHGTTENVARLTIDVSRALPDSKADRSLTIELDGQSLSNLTPISSTDGGRLHLARTGGKWSATSPAALIRKGPHRMGPFKESFRHRFVLVTGTKGTAEENAWGLSRARFDSETFWYRGNGSVDVETDTAFLDPSRADEFRDRDVILYGHAESNAAWPALLGESPVQVRRGQVRIGGRTVLGDDLACLFCRPRPGSDRASVGVVAGSGPAGLRLTQWLPYFNSGVAYPDCLLLSAKMLTAGPSGLIAAGYFGNDWGVESGEFAWRH